MHQDFWRKWSVEYVARLQYRPKWARRHTDIRVGDIVLIKDDQLPPAKWSLGRVKEVYPGNDGLTRVVKLRAKNSEFTRPISKVSLLPITDEQTEPEWLKDEESADTEPLDPETNPDAALTAQREQKGIKRKQDETVILQDGRNNTMTKKKCNRRSKPSTATPLHQNLMSFILLSFLLVLALGQDITPNRTPYQLTTFKDKDGIYFEDLGEVQLYASEWNLIVYYNLDSYWKEFEGIRDSVSKLTHLCTMTRTNEQCSATITQLKYQLLQSEQSNELLYQQNEGATLRNKRAPLEIIGTISNKLFGILDQGFAEKYEQQIKEVKENEDTLRELLKNQTSIAEHTVNVIRRNTQTVHSQLQMIHDHMEVIEGGIHKTQQDLKSSQSFTAAVVLILLHLNNFQQVQRELISVVMDAKHGRWNTLLLTPAQLNYQLKTIREHLPNDLKVPGDGGENSLLSLYKTMHVQMRVTKRNVLFDIKLPLLSTESYYLYHLIPIPAYNKGLHVYIQLSTNYLLVNIHRDRFSPLTTEELKVCMTANDRQLICKQNHPIFSLSSNVSRCEMEMLLHRNQLSPFCTLRSKKPETQWVKLTPPSTWLYVMIEETPYNVICEGSVWPVTLVGSGVIQLFPRCMLHHPTMHINSNNQIPMKLNSSFIPENNIIKAHINIKPKNTTLKHTPRPAQLVSEVEMKDLDELSAAIEFQKEQVTTLSSKWNYHDLHHYTGFYLLVGIGIAFALAYWWKVRNQRSSQPKTVAVGIPVPAPRRAISLELPRFNETGEDVYACNTK